MLNCSLFFFCSLFTCCLLSSLSPVNWMDDQKSSVFSWWMMDKLKRVRGETPEKHQLPLETITPVLLPFVHELWLPHVLVWPDLMIYVFSLSDCFLGRVSVPFDLVKKQPKGQQTFALMTKDTVTGSLTTDVRPRSPPLLFLSFPVYKGLFFYLHTARIVLTMNNWIPQFTYLEPSEVRSWHPPTPASNKRVEMDRTVMPCGTVVTTITAVKSKPGRPLPLGLSTGAPHYWQWWQSLNQRRHFPYDWYLFLCTAGVRTASVVENADVRSLRLRVLWGFHYSWVPTPKQWYRL